MRRSNSNESLKLSKLLWQHAMKPGSCNKAVREQKAVVRGIQLSVEDNTGDSNCHTIHLQSGSVVGNASWIARCARVVSTMTSRHWCYYQHTDTVTNLGSCQSHVGGKFTPMETPRQLQGAVSLGHVASQLGIIAWIGFPIERKGDDVGQD
jgi:hypothetical protein